MGPVCPRIIAVGFAVDVPTSAGCRVTTQAKTTANTITASTNKTIAITWVVLERRRGTARGAG